MATLTESIIVKINSKALESSELKKLDKQEKELIFQNLGNVKGKFFCRVKLLLMLLAKTSLKKKVNRF